MELVVVRLGRDLIPEADTVGRRRSEAHHHLGSVAVAQVGRRARRP